MRIQFLIPGEPVGKERPRFTRAGYVYTPPKTVAYEKDVRTAYLNTALKEDCNRKFPDGVPIKASIDAVFKIPANFSKKNKMAALHNEIMPTKKPDADNIAKAVLDALNGIAYKDDSAVVECSVIKRYGEVGHVSVSLEEAI